MSSSKLMYGTISLAGAESKILPTWFRYFNKELVRTLSFSDHEAFDHPVACKFHISFMGWDGTG